MASGRARPVHQQPTSGNDEEQPDHHDRREPDFGQVEGIHFECQPNCSACCEMEGEVYLSEEDLVRIAGYIHMPVAEFEERHVYRTAPVMRLRKPPDRQCIFHKDNRCSIHAVKPTQCRAFPYWPEIIESENTWNEAAKTCPGMNRGPLIQIEMARKIAVEMHTAFPAMYPEIGISTLTGGE